ncbi:CRP/FNR family transcriptional regulator, anaerobic regulatory protein [Spirosomataceae bacterium TFI 002]|nr:CRP/FNR family transcriptional regulator, anaerobic regulatory protein [Spirosomataceae bacterium TFI 002]
MEFKPFDIACYNKLYERFSFLFEPELIDEICQSGKLKEFDIDACIVDIGDKIEFMPLVVSGSIKIMVEDKEGDELLLYYLEVGDTCAVTLNCCTHKAKSTIRAIAESKVEVLFVPAEKMEDWMVKYKSWRNYILESYNTRLNEMVGAIDNLVFNSMEDRIKKYLRDKAFVGKSSSLHITHNDIANDLHSSRVVISRLMKKLEKEGIIKQNRHKVEFLEFSK